MFGLMRGATRVMTREERKLWMGHICGVCVALRDSAGQISRVTTNYDAALISVLITAQSAEPTQITPTYCPLRRHRTQAITAPNSDASQYGAALALLMAGTKIADHIDDKDGYWHQFRLLSKPLSQRWLRQGGELATRVQFDPQPIHNQVAQQADVEAFVTDSLHVYAEPTMQAAGAVFAHTATLTDQPKNERPMVEIGRNFGLITYLLDAYQDIESDVKHGHFNPLVQLHPPHERQSAAQAAFESAHLALRRAVYQLDLAQPTLLRKLLLKSLQTIGKRTLGMERGRCANGSCRVPAIANSAEFDEEDIQRSQQSTQQQPKPGFTSDPGHTDTGCSDGCALCCDCDNDMDYCEGCGDCGPWVCCSCDTCCSCDGCCGCCCDGGCCCDCGCD